MRMYVCADQISGSCPECRFNIDPEQHPNNLECPKFEPIGFVLIDLREDGKFFHEEEEEEEE